METAALTLNGKKGGTAKGVGGECVRGVGSRVGVGLFFCSPALLSLAIERGNGLRQLSLNM